MNKHINFIMLIECIVVNIEKIDSIQFCIVAIFLRKVTYWCKRKNRFTIFNHSKCILIVQSILYVLNSGDNQLYTVLSILLILWWENSFAVIKVFDGF